jgi:YD repeat-containing protein
MIDERQVFERVMRGFVPPDDSLDRLVRRRDRKRRNQRIGAGALAIILALVSFVALTRAFRSAERPADEPTPQSQSGIYVVDADGGSRRLLLAAGRRTWPDGSTFRTGVGGATFSPDGTQIAYFDGMGDWGNSLRVMNADGSDVRALIYQEFGHVDDLAWSPDGSRLAFDEKYGGIWIVGVDGSGLTEVVPQGDAPRWSPTGSRLVFQSAGGIWVTNADGSGLGQVARVGLDPDWSPDGSRIAYVDEGGSLYVADRDGTHARTLGTLAPPRRPTPVAWNPLPLSASGEPQGISSEVGGWIAYGNEEGIWAVNPTPGRAPSDRIRLSERPGEPVAWSSDGSKLLIRREVSDATRDRGTDFDLFVLNADGTEARLTWNPKGGRTGSFTPDGSKVVYDDTTQLAIEEEQPTATVGGSGAAPFVYAIAFLGAVGVLLIAWRARRRIAAR